MIGMEFYMDTLLREFISTEDLEDVVRNIDDNVVTLLIPEDRVLEYWKRNGNDEKEFKDWIHNDQTADDVEDFFSVMNWYPDYIKEIANEIYEEVKE